MGIFWTAVLFLAGLVLIVKGGDWFLDGAVWMAEITGVPRFVIGATVVSLATTLPELTVSAAGVLKGETDLAVGNAVGSVSANLGLILGLSAVCLPAAVDRRQFPLKALLMVSAAGLLLFLCRGGTLPAASGLALLAVFILYMVSSLRDARNGRKERRGRSGRRRASPGQTAEKLLLFALGVAGIITGSQLLIDYGSRLALLLGVPAGIIGVTLVAVGTSLPELVTTLAAIARKEASMSVGNIVGANVIDLTLILPVCAVLSGGGLTIGPQTTGLDLPVCLALAAAAVLPPLIRGRFYRWQGALLLAVYGFYMVRLIS